MHVGRQQEHAFLASCLAEAQSSGVAAFIGGESGIGKSALLDVLRSDALTSGVRVASHVSAEGTWSPPYAPWIAIFEQLGLEPLETTHRHSDPIPAEEHRFQLHRAATEALLEEGRSHPFVIILDDIQWMDQPSRDLLIHLIPRLREVPVLIVGAWRTPVSERDTGLSSALATLRRDPAVHWLDLRGMSEAEVAQMTQALGWSPEPDVVRQITRETGGNPFFVAELVRFWRGNDGARRTDGDPLGAYGIPTSIRDVVRLRFSQLPERTRVMLNVAAIFTDGFDFPLLAEMTDLPEDDLLDAIDEAIDAAFLRPTERRPEHYDFAHAIVRESLAATWNPSRRARLHRRAAEALERIHEGRTNDIAGDLALQYYLSRSIEGAGRGVPYALISSERASTAFNFSQAADLLRIASELAIGEPLALRAEIHWRLALAEAESLQIDAALTTAEAAVEMLRDADAAPETIASVCWRLGRAIKDGGGPRAAWQHLRQQGLQAIGSRRDMHWARLMLLADPVESIDNDVLFAARWLGYDAEAVRIGRESDNEEDLVQTIESFDPRTPGQTRDLIVRARSWHQPRATLRGLTVAANDLTYRHGEFRLALTIWNEVLTTARRIGSIPWQANALNQITLVHIALGEFEEAVTSKHLADAVNAELGPANDADALHMERDFALTHYLDGDWAAQASFWLQFIGDPPQGFETQLAVPLYAAMAASAAATAGIGTQQALRVIDALIQVAGKPGIQQANGVVAWTADAVAKLGLADRARALDRLATAIIDQGISDYPQTSLALSRARMLTLLGDPYAQKMFETARETLALQGQVPLLGIACYEQAIAPVTSADSRKFLLRQATGIFQRLGMTTWLEQATHAEQTAPVPEETIPAGITKREIEVLRLVARGYSDRRIADELFVSERTVNAHVRNMLQKTAVANRTELSVWAKDHGIVNA
jgi:DNA-binding CsgD family transcriptional regulator/tetratricopeptide (TPR) repeat protein